MQYQLPALDLALKGWRDRTYGTMHLRGDCPDFERLDASQIEDAIWDPDVFYEHMCTWCFPEEVPEPASRPWYSVED